MNSCFENKIKIQKLHIFRTMDGSKGSARTLASKIKIKIKINCISSGPLTVAKALHELVLPNMDSQVPKIDTHTHNGSRASRPHGRTSRRKGDAGCPTPRRVHTHTHTHTHTHKHTHTCTHTYSLTRARALALIHTHYTQRPSFGAWLVEDY